MRGNLYNDDKRGHICGSQCCRAPFDFEPDGFSHNGGGAISIHVRTGGDVALHSLLFVPQRYCVVEGS